MAVIIDPLLREALVYTSILMLLAIGLTLIYLTTRVPNFAHGAVATLGIYVTLTATEVWRVNPYFTFPLAAVIGGFAILGLYLLVLRPLIDRGAGILQLMIATISYELVLVAVINIYADYVTTIFKIQARDFVLRKRDLELLGEPMIFIVAPTLVIVVVTVLYVLLNKTKLGIALRASIENPSLAGAIGINVKLMYGISWFLAGSLAGIAGAMIPLWFQSNPNTGSSLIVSIFAASILGGLFNIYGGAIGGLLIGFTEIYVTSFLASGFKLFWIIPYRPIIPITIMAATLLVIPRGVTGVDWGRLMGLSSKRREGVSMHG